MLLGMYESGEELLHPEEIQQRFKKVFGRDMNRTERDIFFLPLEPPLEQEEEGRMKTKELTLKQINSVRCRGRQRQLPQGTDHAVRATQPVRRKEINLPTPQLR